MSSKVGKSKVETHKPVLNNKTKNNIELKKVEFKKEETKKVDSKNDESKTEICKAARYLNTKQSAIDAINKGIKVYILSEEIGGKIKIRPYTECSRPCYADNDFCWKHSTTPNTLNYVKDVVNNVNSKIAKLEHFQPNSKRKLVKNELISKLQSNDSSKKPILRIKVTEDFIKEIEHILKINHIFLSESKNIKKVQNLKDKVQSVNDEFKKSQSSTKLNKDKESKKEEFIEDEEFENDVNEEDPNNEANTDDEEPVEDVDEVHNEENSEEEVDEQEEEEEEDEEEKEEEDEDEDEDEDEEELDVSEIHTNSGMLLYLSAKDNTVYAPDGDGGGEILGKLMRVATKEAPYHDNNKYYIVGDEITFSGKKYTICKITKMVFSDSKGSNSILKKVGNYDSESKKIIFS